MILPLCGSLTQSSQGLTHTESRTRVSSPNNKVLLSIRTDQGFLLKVVYHQLLHDHSQQEAPCGANIFMTSVEAKLLKRPADKWERRGRRGREQKLPINSPLPQGCLAKCALKVTNVYNKYYYNFKIRNKL